MTTNTITSNASRKLLLNVFLISFAISLAVGIYMILFSNFRQSIELQIFSTSLGVMGFSASLLFSSLLTNDPQLKILGFAGVICSLAGLVMWVYVTWFMDSALVVENAKGIAQLSLTLVVLSAYLGYASLLLYFRNRRFLMIICQIIFLAATTVIAAFLLSWVLNISPFYLNARTWFALVLLTTAGLIMVPVMGRFNKTR